MHFCAIDTNSLYLSCCIHTYAALMRVAALVKTRSVLPAQRGDARRRAATRGNAYIKLLSLAQLRIEQRTCERPFMIESLLVARYGRI